MRFTRRREANDLALGVGKVAFRNHVFTAKNVNPIKSDTMEPNRVPPV